MGDSKMPFILSQGVGTPTHLPGRPWQNKLLQVSRVTPLEEKGGFKKAEGSTRGKGVPLRAPRSQAGGKVPGGVGWRGGNVPRTDRP